MQHRHPPEVLGQFETAFGGEWYAGAGAQAHRAVAPRKLPAKTRTMSARTMKTLEMKVRAVRIVASAQVTAWHAARSTKFGGWVHQ
jgi:hypothetical protein